MYFYFNSEPKVFGGGTDAPTRADSGRLGLGHRAEMSQDRLEVVNFLLDGGRIWKESLSEHHLTTDSYEHISNNDVFERKHEQCRLYTFI